MTPLHSNIPSSNNLRAVLVAMMLILVYQPVLAAGGLDEATNWVNEIASWAYRFLGSAVVLYSIVMVILALLDKKTWGDVGISIARAAAAGGIVAAVTYAWSIWGS